ncbi:MAG: hypothetical protein RLT87_12995 [Gammaproteobacteria bacterium]
MTIAPVLVVLGTFWPVIGLALALIIALLLRSRWRWVGLFVLPLLLQFPTFMFAEQIAYNGNMLFVVMLGFMVVFLLVYYIVLVIVAIVMLIRAWRSPHVND